jgi:uncharacterized protein involved in outer membrane biogenesis
VRGNAQIDARTATPTSRVDFAVTDLHLEDLAPKVQGSAPIQGILEARAQLSGQGDTVHKAAASSNGRISVAIPPGKMRRSIAELMGVNVVPGLFQYLSKSPRETGLRCAVADFDVRGGMMTARRILLDTDSVLLDGGGTLNLNTERIDLSLEGHSKKLRLMRVKAPFDIHGSLARPALTIETGHAVAQAGAAVGLGAVLSPVAAILPFLSLGGAHDADCAALLSEARSAGAPVRVAHIAWAAQPKIKAR